jgi:hypothetical protein
MPISSGRLTQAQDRFAFPVRAQSQLKSGYHSGACQSALVSSAFITEATGFAVKRMYIRIEDQDHPYSLPRPFIPFEAGCHWEIRQGLIWPKIHCQSELYCRRFNPGCYNLYVLYAAFYHFSLAAAGLGSGFCAEVQGSISSRGSSELLRQPAHITP